MYNPDSFERELIASTYTILGVINLCAVIVTAYIILNHSPPVFGQYKWIQINILVATTFFDTFSVLGSSITISPYYGYMRIAKWTVSPFFFHICMTGIFVGLSLQVVSIMVAFYYRTAKVDLRLTKKMLQYRFYYFVPLYTFPVLLSALLTCTYFSDIEQRTDKILRADPHLSFLRNETMVLIYSFDVIYMKAFMWLSAVYLLVTNPPSVCCVVYCLWTLHSNRTRLSQQTLKLQKTMMKCLIVQAAIPCLTTMVLFVANFLSMLLLDSNQLIAIFGKFVKLIDLNCLFGCGHSLLNALAVICLTKPYRETAAFFGFSLQVVSITIAFYYRTVKVADLQVSKKMIKYRFYFFAPMYVASVVLCTLTMCTYYSDIEGRTKSIVRNDPYLTFLLNEPEVLIYSFDVIYTKIFMGICVVFVFATLPTVGSSFFYCMWALHMNRRNLSPQTLKLQKAMMKCLVVQAAAPSVTIVAPFIAYFSTLLLFDSQTVAWFGFFTRYFDLSILIGCMHSTLNANVVIFLTKPYRELSTMVFDAFAVLSSSLIVSPFLGFLRIASWSVPHGVCHVFATGLFFGLCIQVLAILQAFYYRMAKVVEIHLSRRLFAYRFHVFVPLYAFPFILCTLMTCTYFSDIEERTKAIITRDPSLASLLLEQSVLIYSLDVIYMKLFIGFGAVYGMATIPTGAAFFFVTLGSLLNNRQRLSPQTLKLQVQMLKCLCAQVAVPLFTLIVPCVTVFVSAIVGSSYFEKLSGLTCLIGCTHSTLNAIVVIFLTKPYRQGFLRIFRCCGSTSKLGHAVSTRMSVTTEYMKNRQSSLRTIKLPGRLVNG